MRILLVEDDNDLADGIVTALQRSGGAVDRVASVADGKALVHTDDFDLVVLDLGLPDGDGMEVLRSARNRNIRTPVLILSARADLSDRVRGLDLGADDFLAKPFALEELEARLRALVRRHRQEAGSTITVGRMSFDLVGRRARIEDEEIPFTARELSVLEVLLLRRGDVIAKGDIAERIYTLDDEVNTTAIEIFVHRIRKKTKDAGFTIRTIRGLGYLLEEG